MAVYRTVYKDRPAVAVESEKLLSLFLPLDGGKMASLKTSGGHELLAQAPGESYRVLTADGSYVDAECSGFDDMFPTIDPYTPKEGAYAGLKYPDHGEMCRMPVQEKINETGVQFCAVSSRFPIIFTKRINAEPDGAIAIHYTIRNRGQYPFPCIWAAHCMLAGEDSAEIITSFGGDAPIRMMFGPNGADSLSRTRLSGFTPDGATYKYYFLRPVPQGICGYRYPLRGEELLLKYDGNRIPYLGVWLNNGGFKGMYNVALEPCTAPFDRPDAAEEAGCGSSIPAGGSADFTLRFCLY